MQTIPESKTTAKGSEMKKVLYIMNIGDAKMSVSNKPYPNAESVIEQHEADITTWAEAPKGAMIACYDVQGAANQHAHLLCWHIANGAEMDVIKAIALATEKLVEYVEEIQDTEPPGEPHTTH